MIEKIAKQRNDWQLIAQCSYYLNRRYLDKNRELAEGYGQQYLKYSILADKDIGTNEESKVISAIGRANITFQSYLNLWQIERKQQREQKLSQWKWKRIFDSKEAKLVQKEEKVGQEQGRKE